MSTTVLTHDVSCRDERLSARLHRNIRLGNYNAVRALIANCPEALWEGNSVGWTALHFCASHETPPFKWWRWVLGRALETQATNQFETAALPSLQGTAFGETLKRYLCLGYDQDLRQTLSSATQDGFAKHSLILTRTDLGYSTVDLFFLKCLHPLPWQRPEVHEAATALKCAIECVLHDTASLQMVRNGIAQLQQQERNRQAQWEALKHKNDDMFWLQSGEVTNDDNIVVEQWSTNVSLVVQFWHKMELLLIAAYLGTLDFSLLEFDNADGGSSKRKWRVVHALAHTGCPTHVANLALALYPNQAKERDEQGNLPLHIAAASPAFVVEEGNDNDDDDTACPPMLKALLDAYPHAAACLNQQERLPIHVALSSGKTWQSVVQPLFTACPGVLHGRDVPTHLCCFMLAAIPTPDQAIAKRRAAKQSDGMWVFLPPEAQEWALKDATDHLQHLQVNTIYKLLRAMPDAVRYGIPRQTTTTRQEHDAQLPWDMFCLGIGYGKDGFYVI